MDFMLANSLILLSPWQNLFHFSLSLPSICVAVTACLSKIGGEGMVTKKTTSKKRRPLPKKFLDGSPYPQEKKIYLVFDFRGTYNFSFVDGTAERNKKQHVRRILTKVRYISKQPFFHP
jgi:hypothetical protein